MKKISFKVFAVMSAFYFTALSMGEEQIGAGLSQGDVCFCSRFATKLDDLSEANCGKLVSAAASNRQLLGPTSTQHNNMSSQPNSNNVENIK